MRKSSVALMTLAALVGLYRARDRNVAPVIEPDIVADAVDASALDAPSAREPAAVVAAPRLPIVADLPTPPRAVELRRYHELASKVFTTDDEATEMKRLRQDADTLKAASAQLVLQQVPDGILAKHQDQALALLLDAARAGEPVAIAALTAVVKDGAVEDARLEAPIRTQLAGLKAEAMFEWSSANPELTAQIDGWLPGPVSRRLWANVLERQRLNQATSVATMNGGKVAR